MSLIQSIYAKISSATLVLALALPANLRAQDNRTIPRVATSADSVPLTIAAAAMMGARWPKPDSSPAHLNLMRGEASGGPERKCVEAKTDAVRSGEVMAGPLAHYSDIWHQGSSKIWWVVLQNTGDIRHPDPLIVRAVQLDSIQPVLIFEHRGTAYSPGATADPNKYFYPSGTRLPNPGRWMLIATAGPNWGCFILDFK